MTHEEISLQTKRQLADALKAAMKTKPFSKITVSELIQSCGMNRKTFYYHFQDIYALLVWMFEQEAIDVVRKFDLILDYEEALTFIMDYIEENDLVLNCAYDSIGRDALRNFFRKDFEEIAGGMICEAEEIAGQKLDPGYHDYLCRFYVEALSGLMVDWIRDRKTRDRKAYTKYIVDSIRDSLLGILNPQTGLLAERKAD